MSDVKWVRVCSGDEPGWWWPLGKVVWLGFRRGWWIGAGPAFVAEKNDLAVAPAPDNDGIKRLLPITAVEYA